MSTITATNFQITPLDAALGAVVTGLDASQAVAPKVILQLKQTLRDRHILIFKNQQLSDEQFLNFSLYFGALFIPSDETPVLAINGLLVILFTGIIKPLCIIVKHLTLRNDGY